MGIVSFSRSLWKPTVNYENAMGFQLLNHAGTFGNSNTEAFESTEMREKLREKVFSKTRQGGWCLLNIYQDF